MMSDIEITQSSIDNRIELANLHYKCLPDDFLPSLGIDFLRDVYYPSALKSSNAVTYTASLECVVVGFVTIACDSAAYSREIIKGNYARLAKYALRAILHDPSHIVKSAKVLWASTISSPDPISAEIVLIAVDPNHQNRGIGKGLVQKSLIYLEQNNVSKCRTKTISTNQNVIGMYKKLGWSIRNHFQFIGKNYVTLVFDSSSK